MTPREKAQELLIKFALVGLQRRDEGLQCAKIAVDELIDYLREWGIEEYWEEVKIELEKI